MWHSFCKAEVADGPMLQVCYGPAEACT